MSVQKKRASTSLFIENIIGVLGLTAEIEKQNKQIK